MVPDLKKQVEQKEQDAVKKRMIFLQNVATLSGNLIIQGFTFVIQKCAVCGGLVKNEKCYGCTEPTITKCLTKDELISYAQETAIKHFLELEKLAERIEKSFKENPNGPII